MADTEQLLQVRIASLMIEKYLRQKITRIDLEKRILATSLQSEYAILGGLSETVKSQMRISDSLLKKKTFHSNRESKKQG